MIRNFDSNDAGKLAYIHGKQGIDYPMPNLESPLFRVKLVAGPAEHIVTQALFVRVTSECYLLMDKESGTPRQRFELFKDLHQAACQTAWQDGFEDGHIWIPPEIDKSFGRRLMRLGWTKPLWPCYTKKLEGF